MKSIHQLQLLALCLLPLPACTVSSPPAAVFVLVPPAHDLTAAAPANSADPEYRPALSTPTDVPLDLSPPIYPQTRAIPVVFNTPSGRSFAANSIPNTLASDRPPSPKRKTDAFLPAQATTPDDSSVWMAGGPILANLDHQSATTIEGTIASITQESFSHGVASARALRVRLPGPISEETLVLLGPSWFVNLSKLGCKVGDPITVVASRATIDGSDFWLARSFDCKGTHLIILDQTNSPAWDPH